MRKAYHDQNATKKPNHAKKKTRPYMLKGFRPGIERALRLTGLTTGGFHSVVGLNILRGANGSSFATIRDESSKGSLADLKDGHATGEGRRYL